MANNLGKLRKEFKLTQADLAAVLDTSTTNIGYYEQEKRDFSTKLLLKLSDYFKVNIDYLLGNTDTGIKLYYEGESIIEYETDEEMLDYYLKANVIYYKNDSYKRYISIHHLLGLPGGYNLDNLMENIYTLKELHTILPNMPLKDKEDLDRLYSISKIKQLDRTKLNAIKKILELL